MNQLLKELKEQRTLLNDARNKLDVLISAVEVLPEGIAADLIIDKCENDYIAAFTLVLKHIHKHTTNCKIEIINH